MNVEKSLKKYIQTLPKALLEVTDAIYLYGSMARGDASVDSDCDVLIAIQDCHDEQYTEFKIVTDNWHPELNCEFAIYQISALKAMQKKGSLFLWHIKTEGKKLFSNGCELERILNDLPPYDGSRDAMDEYAEIMNDINLDNTDVDEVINYNLSVIATLIRNICIICCFKIGNLQFGRLLPVKICSSYFGEQFPVELRQYEILYCYRIAFNRGGSLPHQNDLMQYYNYWKDKTNKLLNLAFSILEGEL